MLLVILAAVSLVFATRGASTWMKNADPIARQFMQYVSTGEDDKAYALTSSEMRKVSPLKDFKRFTGMWRTGMGTLKSATQNGMNWYGGTGGTRITLVYAVEGSTGAGQVTIVLVTEGGQLRVQSANFNPRSAGAP